MFFPQRLRACAGYQGVVPRGQDWWLQLDKLAGV